MTAEEIAAGRKRGMVFALVAVLLVAAWFFGAAVERRKYAKSEAEAAFQATWLCNYIASLSAGSGERFKTECLAGQLQDHFEGTSHAD